MLNPRIEPQAKPVRIRIEVGGEEHSSIKSLKEKFDIKDVFKLYEDGSLLKWLNGIGENNFAQQIEELKANTQNEDKNKQIFAIFKLFFPGTYGMDYSGFDELKMHLRDHLESNPENRPVDSVLRYLFDESTDPDFLFRMYAILHNGFKYEWGRWFCANNDANYKRLFAEKAVSYSDFDEVFAVLSAIENPTKDYTFTLIMEQAKDKASEKKCSDFLLRICERLYNKDTTQYWNSFFKSCCDRGTKYDYARIIFRKEQNEGNYKARAFLIDAIEVDEDMKKFMQGNFPVTNVKEWIDKTVKVIDSYGSEYSDFINKMEEKYPEKKHPHEYGLIKMIYKIEGYSNDSSLFNYSLKEGDTIKKQFDFLKTEINFWTIVSKSYYDRFYYNYVSNYKYKEIRKQLKEMLKLKKYQSMNDYPLIKDILAGKWDNITISNSKKIFFEKMFDNNPSLYAYFDYA